MLERKPRQEAQPEAQLRPIPDGFWLTVILVLALALRLVSLNSPLWWDEIATVETHLRMGWGDMLTSYSTNHHYLHNIMAKAAMEVFGEQPWALRLPSLAFGLAAIAVMWFLAREIAGALPAHATALLLALSYHHIWFSQNARGYTGLAFFSTLGLLLFLRGLQSGNIRIWLAFGAAFAATVFTHLTGAFFFVTLGLVWLAVVATQAVQGRLIRATVTLPLLGFVVGGVLTLLLYLPILPSLLAAVSGVAETSAGDVMQEYQNPLWTVYEAIRTGVGQAGPLVAVVGLAVLGLSILGAMTLHKKAPLFAPITLANIVLTAAILMAVGMRVWPRFFFPDIAFILLLMVMGVQSVCQIIARLTGARLGALLFPIALVAMAAVSGVMALRNYASPKQDLAGAFAYAAAHRQPGERVIIVAPPGNVLARHFHADWPTIFSDSAYRALIAEPGAISFIVVFPARSFRAVPGLSADHDSKLLTEQRYFPGTLGDGGLFILHRG
jgi:4-amino-4-deoxy-L-arabinose transferase-like glycosyltransferase